MLKQSGGLQIINIIRKFTSSESMSCSTRYGCLHYNRQNENTVQISEGKNISSVVNGREGEVSQNYGRIYPEEMSTLADVRHNNSRIQSVSHKCITISAYRCPFRYEIAANFGVFQRTTRRG